MDGFEGLAAAIFLAMICMVVVPVLVFGALGWLATRKKKGWVGALAGAALGVTIGAGLIAYTFYADDLTRTQLEFSVPSDFAHDWVVLMEDPSSTVDITWSRGGLAPRGTLSVPSNGVVRLRTLEGVTGEDVEARLADGRPAMGGMARPNFPELGGGYLVMYSFRAYGDETEPDFQNMVDDEIVARIRQLEAE